MSFACSSGKGVPETQVCPWKAKLRLGAGLNLRTHRVVLLHSENAAKGVSWAEITKHWPHPRKMSHTTRLKGAVLCVTQTVAVVGFEKDSYPAECPELRSPQELWGEVPHSRHIMKLLSGVDLKAGPWNLGPSGISLMRSSCIGSPPTDWA